MKRPIVPRHLCFVIFATLCISVSDGDWQIVNTKNPVPNRGECGMASCNGKLYLLGGGVLPTQIFDPATKTWSPGAACPVDMNHFEAVSLGNNIYVLEAFTEGRYPDQPNLPNVYIYDTKKDSWSKGGSLPADRQRAAAGAAVYRDKLYLAAGIFHGHSTGTNALFDEYDPATQSWKSLADAPHIRDHCSAAVLGDKLYVAGGRNTSYHEPSNFMSFFGKTVLEVDCFDFAKGQWSTLPAKLPLGTGGGALVAVNGKLIYMGGERASDTEENRPRADVFVLDPLHDDHWQKGSSLHEARNGMAAAVIGSAVYVFGGAGPKTPPMPNGPRNDTARRPPPPSPNAGPQPASPLEVLYVSEKR